MGELQLLVDFYKNAYRQGPGGDAETEKAIALASLDRATPLKIADIGCGTGASSLVLARFLNAEVTAVDFLGEFLEVLKVRSESLGLSDKITTLACSMDSLPFGDEEYDVIWSEGAIYNMGFANGARAWNRFLKAGGLLVVSEITWLTASRPAELQEHWANEYPEIDLASSKLRVLETCGYSPIGYFTLPEHCWLENFYGPMQEMFGDFLERHGHSEDAQKIVDAERKEIDLFSKYRDYYNYGVYLTRKVE